MIQVRTSQGFTAVELLITLFVAAAFLVGGYQLFNVIIKDSGEARAEASASNVAYDYLRRYSDSVSNPCAAGSPLTNQSVSLDGLADLQASVSVTVTCPQKDAPSISQVEATLTYGTGAEARTVRQATFVDKSRGASSQVEVTNGLIAWWKLNENANSSVGSFNGTPYLTSPANNRSSVGASAFSFNGSSSYVKIPIADFPRPTSGFSVTGWFRADVITPSGDRVILSSTQGGGVSFYLGSSCSSGMLRFQAYIAGAYTGVCSAAGSIVAGQWYFAAGTYNGSTLRLYINNGSATSLSAPGAMTWPTSSTVPMCLGAEPGGAECTDGNYWDGVLDDIRFYNRELSASEVLQLYNGGPR